MSVALNRTTSGADHNRNMVCGSSSIYSLPEFAAMDRKLPMVENMPADVLNGSPSSSSSTTSSIGKNSDESGGGGGGDEEEVQSECKGGPLEGLDALEEVLPVKKSISRYYRGKSKSFTSLSDAVSCSSIREITKPENEYTRKRKNLLAFNNFFDKNRNVSRRSNGGISKKHTNSRSMFYLMASSEANNSSTSNLLSPGCSLPPLPPLAPRSKHYEIPGFPTAARFSSLRSFSLSDFQGSAVDFSSDSIA